MVLVVNNAPANSAFNDLELNAKAQNLMQI